jgi:hypothetical protein
LNNIAGEFKVTESALYDLWKKQGFKHPLKTCTGEEITVLDCGSHSEEIAGPDFKNARIRIGNLTYVGDIEIDPDYSDWKSHGHNIDNKYVKVILHVAFHNRSNYGYVYTRDGRKVTSICLANFMDKETVKSLDSSEHEPVEETMGGIKCSNNMDRSDIDAKQKFLHQLGSDRYQKKCKKIFERLRELQFINELGLKEPVVSYDLSAQFHERKFTHSDFTGKEIWQQLLYELIFEALGYSKNKSQMMSLAQAANINFISKIETDGVILEKYEAALLNISGLAQTKESISEDVSAQYIERMNLHWNSIRLFYDGKLYDEAQWHFFRLRPQNFPTVRIAGGVRLLREIVHGNLIGTLIKKITEIHNITVLINSIRSLFVIKSDGFWRTHYVLDQTASAEIKYFVGAARADEIVVNVILPFFSVYFDVFGNQNLSKKVLKMYDFYEQKSENQIINEMAEALQFHEQMKRTIYAQGMIELFRNYCSKNKCLECEIGKSVFN